MKILFGFLVIGLVGACTIRMAEDRFRVHQREPKIIYERIIEEPKEKGEVLSSPPKFDEKDLFRQEDDQRWWFW